MVDYGKLIRKNINIQRLCLGSRNRNYTIMETTFQRFCKRERRGYVMKLKLFYLTFNEPCHS